MDVFLNTLFIKKYIFFSVHFSTHLFFLIQVKGGGTPPLPRSEPGESAGLSPRTKEENGGKEIEVKEAGHTQR